MVRVRDGFVLLLTKKLITLPLNTLSPIGTWKTWNSSVALLSLTCFGFLSASTPNRLQNISHCVTQREKSQFSTNVKTNSAAFE